MTFLLYYFVAAVLSVVVVTAVRGRTPAPFPEPLRQLPPPPDNTFNCAVWDIRQFEKKLVEAGISSRSDMTVCKDAQCNECLDDRRYFQSIVNARRQARRVPIKGICVTCGKPGIHTHDHEVIRAGSGQIVATRITGDTIYVPEAEYKVWS